MEPRISAPKDGSDGTKPCYLDVGGSKWPYSDRQYKASIVNCEEDGAVDGQATDSRACSWKAFLCSKPLWFVVAAMVQMCAAVALQVNVYFNGGDGSTVDEYRNCVSTNLQLAIDCNVRAVKPIEISVPSFGRDKPVYVGFIIALTVYNTILCIYALYGKHFLEIISFLIVNVLTMVYAAFEAWQFRPFAPNCTRLPDAAKFALGTMGILFAFTILFITLTFYIYRDFGWKVYKHVECNHEMRRYFQWYEAVSSGVKLVILFTIVFLVGQLSLLLLPADPEFVLTIILVVVAIVAYFIIQLSIHYNSFTGYLLIAFVGVLLFAYYPFKIARFAAISCPTCIRQQTALQNEYDQLQSLLRNCTGQNLTISSADGDRSIQFQSLVIFASVNLITVIVVFVIFIGFWCHQPGKKVMEHFQKHPSLIVWLMCYRQGEDSLFVQITKALHLRNKPYDSSQYASNEWIATPSKLSLGVQ